MPPNSDSELEVSDGNVHRDVLDYNVNWMVSTFRSRATAEALLSPERESGNLTSRDYDAAIQFLPGSHHYYSKIGLAVGTVLGMVFRHPRLSTRKQIFIFLGTAYSGHVVGKMRQLYVHNDYLRGIENPDGYKQAMKNVQKDLGRPIRGLILRRVYQISPDDAFPQPTSEHESSSIERSQSKWDQIRAANSRTAQNSAWDALRQQHEKIRVNPNSQDRDDDKWNTPDG